MFPQAQLVFLMGSDAVLTLPTWRHAGRLMEQAEFVVGLRTAQQQKAVVEKKEETTAATIGGKKKKLSFNEKREFEQIEKEIPKLEKEKEEITAQMSNPSLPYDDLQKLSNRITEITNLLEEKEMRWLELSELAGD